MIARHSTNQRSGSHPCTVSDGLFTHLGSPVEGCPPSDRESHDSIWHRITIAIFHRRTDRIGLGIVRHRPAGDSKVGATYLSRRLIRDKGRGFRRRGVGTHRCRDSMITRDQTNQSCCGDPGVVGGRRLADLGGPVKGCAATHRECHIHIGHQISLGILHRGAHRIGRSIIRNSPTGDCKVGAANFCRGFIGHKGRGFRGSCVSAHSDRDAMITRDPTDQ
ncbi:Uncharacterised protein [Yersinia frederiksenii]|nr:Uncharacterised protein [Yersinia frederiksenii]